MEKRVQVVGNSELPEAKVPDQQPDLPQEASGLQVRRKMASKMAPNEVLAIRIFAEKLLNMKHPPKTPKECRVYRRALKRLQRTLRQIDEAERENPSGEVVGDSPIGVPALGHNNVHVDDTSFAKPRFFGCNKCEKRFFSNAALLQHIRKRHLAVYVTCEICNKDCRHPAKLMRHLKVCGNPNIKVKEARKPKELKKDRVKVIKVIKIKVKRGAKGWSSMVKGSSKCTSASGLNVPV